MAKKATPKPAGKKRVPKSPPQPEAAVEVTAFSLLDEMVKAGASKSRIAEELGVSYPTIISVASGKTATFGKMDELQKLYSGWKATLIDLKGQRGRKPGSKNKAAEDAPKPAAKRGPKPKVASTTVPSFGSELPDFSEAMVLDVERQIEELKMKVQFMKDVISLKSKYSA